MAFEYPIVEPPQFVYRVVRGEGALAFRPWDTITEEAPLLGRFDDSYKKFRSIYTASSKEAAYRETLQDFRGSTALGAKLAAIEPNADGLTDLDPNEYLGVIPASWLADRSIGVLEVTKPCACVDITHASAIDRLRVDCARAITVADLLGDDVMLTQSLARRFWSHRDGYAGIAYPSKLGANLMNFAFFETSHCSDSTRANLLVRDTQPLRADDPTLADVANSMGLLIEGLDAVNAAATLFPGSVPAYMHVRAALAATPEIIVISENLDSAASTGMFIVQSVNGIVVIVADEGSATAYDVTFGSPQGSTEIVWYGAISGEEAARALMVRVVEALGALGTGQTESTDGP